MNLPPLVVATAAGLIVALAVWLYRAHHELRRLHRHLESAATQLQHLQASFSRFAPDEVIERVIANGVSSQGEKKVVTVLFADLVGFTALSERVEPAVLVRILNGYFETMSRAITENRGHVSTFIGDGILALFGALQPNPWQADDAVRAALAMRAALAAYNQELAAEGLPTLRIGMGVHRGEGVAGLVGSRDLMEFAFVGRTVNVAARIQELTRQYPADIIVTERLRETLDASFRTTPLPPTPVKGVAQPLRIHAVAGQEPGPESSQARSARAPLVEPSG
jgi:class 3 adenylate cyclase